MVLRNLLYRFSLVLLLAAHGALLLPAEEVNPPAGVLDLREADFSDSDTLPLNGVWDFYWKKFIDPKALPTEAGAPVQVPGNWTDAESEREISVRGWGSYRLRILLPENSSALGLYVPYFTSSYRIFINGREIVQNAPPRMERRPLEVQVRPQVVLLPAADELELVAHVSNHHDVVAGFTKTFRIGRLEKVISRRENRALYDVMLFGSLFIIGLYHLNFYILRRKDQGALFFGLFSMLIGIRSLFYGEQIILILFPNIPPELMMTMGHMTQSLSVPLLLHFVHTLFPHSFSRYYLPFFDGASLLYTLLTIIFPHHIYINFLVYYNVITLLTGLYLLFLLGNAILTGTRHALVFLTGFLILLGTAVNDILLSYQIVHTFHVAAYGQLAFIVSQALILSFDVTEAFNRAEALTLTLTRINRAFRRFVPKEFLSFLKIEDIAEVKLGDHVEETMTVMFADIRSFTNLSEQLTPEENFLFINSYLSRMGPIIRKYDGFIDKYIGDAIMALFPKGPDTALMAAVEMQKELREYNRQRESIGYKKISVGIGIHTGELMLGTVGESERMESTVISDSVNLCARIEKLTKTFGIRIAISEKSFQMLDDPSSFYIRFIAKVTVKGKNQPVAIFDCFDGDPEEEIEQKIGAHSEFEKGVGHYYMQEMDAAESYFTQAAEKAPSDKAPRFYLQRMREMIPMSAELPKEGISSEEL